MQPVEDTHTLVFFAQGKKMGIVGDQMGRPTHQRTCDYYVIIRVGRNSWKDVIRGKSNKNAFLGQSFQEPDHSVRPDFLLGQFLTVFEQQIQAIQKIKFASTPATEQLQGRAARIAAQQGSDDDVGIQHRPQS